MSEESLGSCAALGIEVNASECIGVCLSSEGAIIASDRAPIANAEESVNDLCNFVGELKSKYGSVERIGVALPGLIRRETSRVDYSARIPSHVGIDIAKHIKSATDLDAVLENDANAAGFAEYKLGAGRGSKHMFYATIGTGIGGAFIIDGRVWHGAAGFAGEFGYVAVNSDGMRLEDVASAENIVRRTRARFHQDNTSSLNKLNEQAITIDDILNAATAEDDFARLMLERTGNYIGTAVANVINLLNIETIVIGGPIMQAGNVLLNAIVRSARELSFAPSFESTLILAGELGERAAACGAALLAADSDR
jgi:glucokinase